MAAGVTGRDHYRFIREEVRPQKCHQRVGVCGGDCLGALVFSRFPRLTNYIGNLVGRMLYPPLSTAEAAREMRCASLYFDSKVHASVHAPFRDRVNENFSRDAITVSELTGARLKATYLMMQSKWAKPSDPSHNLVIFSGNKGAIELDQNADAFARAFIEEENSRSYQVKIFVVSARNIGDAAGYEYRVPFRETGKIHEVILDKIKREHGPIHQIVAISLGCGVAAALMDLIDDRKIGDIRSWWLHAGPASLEKLSARYWCGRTLLYPAAREAGWDVNPAESLARFCARLVQSGHKERVFIGVSGLHGKADYYFPDQVGLCQTEEVLALAEQKVIDEAIQFELGCVKYHERAHHGLPMDHFDLTQVVDPATQDYFIYPIDETPAAKVKSKEHFLKPGEHLPRAIVRQALSAKR